MKSHHFCFAICLFLSTVFLCMFLPIVSGLVDDDEPLAEMIKSLLPTNFIENNPLSQPARRNIQIKNAKSKHPINNAEKMFHGLENIFKSLNEPDNGNCHYECPNGAKLTPKPGFKTVPNGCGSHGFKIDVSSLPGLGDCCNQHDICYGTCGKGQAECDRAFNTCLSDSCQQMRNTGIIKTDKALEECRAVGATFYLTVMSIGCEFLRESQTKACECISPDTPSSPAQEKIRQYNREVRDKEATKDAETIAEELLDSGIDFSNPMFDLPEAIDRDEL